MVTTYGQIPSQYYFESLRDLCLELGKREYSRTPRFGCTETIRILEERGGLYSACEAPRLLLNVVQKIYLEQISESNLPLSLASELRGGSSWR